MPPSAFSRAAQAKLSLSGLTVADANALSIEFLSAKQTAFLGLLPHPALKFNYLGPDKEPMVPHQGDDPFFRVRYLPDPASLDGQTEKPPRYAQLAGTGVAAYFPALVDWRALVADANQPLILTEGELKAACATKHDFPTVGLGGVYSWRSVGRGVEFLPELESISWVKRHVYLCFDSDYRQNGMVCAALGELANELADRGAWVKLVMLPTLAEAPKTGLDDFLVSEGAEAFLKLLQQASPLGLSAPLFALNEKYTYIENPGLVVGRETRQRITPSNFTEHLEATKKYREPYLKNGEVQYKRVAAAKAWLTWPLRRQAPRLTYAPGLPLDTEEGLNLWPGWGCQPKQGDTRPFFRLLRHVLTGAEDWVEKWLLRWMAYPLQNPGAKMYTSLVVFGATEGTGKSLLGYTLGRIYGKNFGEIGQRDLHADFTGWGESKQFVMGDDVTGSDRRQDADHLKKLITQREFTVNVKYIPTYTVPDTINYYFTSNHPDAFFLGDTDRRYFVHEVTAAALPADFRDAYRPWFDGDGPAALFWHLLHKVDCTGFDPAAPAPLTAAKERMREDVQSDVGAWVRRLMRDPEPVLKVGEVGLTADFYSATDLLRLYDPMGRSRVTSIGLGRELRRAGCKMAAHGLQIRTPIGSYRFYIVRNVEKWARATEVECLQHLKEVQ